MNYQYCMGVNGRFSFVDGGQSASGVLVIQNIRFLSFHHFIGWFSRDEMTLGKQGPKIKIESNL